MRAVLLLPLLAGCAPHLSCDDAVGARPLGCAAPWSRPENTWPASDPPEGLVGQGMDPGEVVYDVRGTDQFGDELSLWQFHGSYVLIDLSTMWCAPCQELAKGTEALYQDYRERGFVYLTVLHENEVNEPVSVEELGLWAGFAAYGPEPYDVITAPIVSDPKGVSGSIEAIRNNQYPVALLVGPDLTVLERIEPATEGAIRDALDEALP